MTTNTIPELAPIRADEDFDHNKLAEYLRTHIEEAPREGEADVLQFPGGHSNLTYLVRIGDNEYVVRRPPLGPVAPKAHDMGREFKVLSKLYQVFPQAPRAYLYCEDPSIIGAPFLVMERRCGTVIRNMWPEEFGEDMEIRNRVSESLVDTLAGLHKVDFKSIGLGDFGKPEGFVERQVSGWSERWERAKTREIRSLDEIVAWLREKMPASPVASLLHNDFKLDNVMLGEGTRGQITSVFDWEMSTLGDPLIDLGTTLAYWVHVHLPGSDGRRFIPSQMPGFFTREQILDRYSEKTGFDVSSIAYYEAFALFKNAVVLEQIYVRFVRGQTQDRRFQVLGMVVEPLIKLALEIANKSNL